MEDDWEQIADSKQIVVPPAIKPNVNKWDGEDEEDDVKESWEEEEEEKKDEEKKDAVAVKAKPKKSLAEKIAEKEKLKQEEMERKRKLLVDDDEDEDLTPEERIAEKLRLQKIQEENDLKTALETLGITDKTSTGIDAMNPTTKSEFSELSDAISKKVAQFKAHNDYPVFVEELVRNICANLTSMDLRKVKGTLDTLYLEKQKLEKEKTKKGKSGKGKAGLRVERNDATNAEEAYGYGDYDYDDFM